MRPAGTAAAVLLLASVAAAGCASRDAFPAPGPIREADRADGYLDDRAVMALVSVLPAPPAPGSEAEAADIAASRQLAWMRGGDRWMLAALHAELSPGHAAQHFDCPLNVRLAEARTPALRGLMERVLEDLRRTTDKAQRARFQARPVAGDPDRACVRLSRATRTGASWPSAAAAAGTAWGLALADAAPDRASELRRIGHEIGLSRAICGLEHPSDVAAGQALGEALFAALSAEPAFQADLARAKDEISVARLTPAPSPACAAERAALRSVADQGPGTP